MADYQSLGIKKSLIPGIALTASNYILCGGVALFLEKGTLQYPEAKDLKLVVIGLAVYFFLVFAFIFRQGLGLNLLNPQLVTSEDPVVQGHIKNLYRTALNTLEQAPGFLISLLVYAGLVNARRGGILCLAYCAFLAPYPGLFGTGGKMSMNVFASTMPRYYIVTYMIVAPVLAALRT